jgi:hypothetical protein
MFRMNIIPNIILTTISKDTCVLLELNGNNQCNNRFHEAVLMSGFGFGVSCTGGQDSFSSDDCLEGAGE